MNLGRFQPGQVVTIGVVALDSGGSPVTPDAAPVATITGTQGVVWSGKISMAPPSTKEFRAYVFLGVPYSLGTYTVSYQWVVGGFTGTGSDTFDVIHGGDVGGRIIAMYAYDRPEARYVVAQLTSGNIVQGRNPRL